MGLYLKRFQSRLDRSNLDWKVIVLLEMFISKAIRHFLKEIPFGSIQKELFTPLQSKMYWFFNSVWCLGEVHWGNMKIMIYWSFYLIVFCIDSLAWPLLLLTFKYFVITVRFDCNQCCNHCLIKERWPLHWIIYRFLVRWFLYQFLDRLPFCDRLVYTVDFVSF